MCRIYTKLTNMNIYFMKEVFTLNGTFPETFSAFSRFQTKCWGKIPETIIIMIYFPHLLYNCPLLIISFTKFSHKPLGVFK